MRKIPYWYLLLLPSMLWVLGYLMNVSVVAANHGQMPVEGPTECEMHAAELRGDSIHTCMDKTSHLKFLGDWMFMPEGMGSPGDWCITAYEQTAIPCWLIWAALMIVKKDERY